MRRRSVLGGALWVLGILLVVASLARAITLFSFEQPAETASQPPTISTSSDPGDWALARYDISGTAYTAGAGIDSSNVGQLSQRWTYSGKTPFSATPVVLGDVVYTTTGKSMYAFDLQTGKALWHFDDIPNKYGSLLTSAVSVAPSTHMAYYGTPDARVYAVNTETHQGVWNVQLGDPAHGAFIWDTPLLINGKLYIGLASQEDDPCNRGAVFALDPATGQTLWRHYLVSDLKLGGGVWSSITANATDRTLLITTGYCAGTHSIEEQDSILALDWDTGDVRWQFHALNHDTCDCDFAAGAVGFNYGGQSYVVAGNKYGVVYGIHPPASPGETPTLLWQTRITGTGYLTSGGVFQPPAYHDGLIFLTGGPTLDGACRHGAVWALDAQTGVPRWRHCTAAALVLSNALSKDVLFIGDNDAITAYEAQTGRILWSAPITGPIWGGIAIAHGMVLIGTVPGVLHAFALPSA
jgi:outer membrane protein assembly factor BamB